MLRTPASPHKSCPSPDNRGWSYTQPETGVVLRQHSLEVLQGMVEDHRWAVAGKDIKVDLAYGWEHRLMDDICAQNPLAACVDNPIAEGYEPPHAVLGRQLWGELHAKADSELPSQSWFDAWLNKVPNYAGCRCRSNAIQLLNQMPPNFSSQEGFKAWAISFHDEVSKRLGKPTLAQLLAAKQPD